MKDAAFLLIQKFNGVLKRHDMQRPLLCQCQQQRRKRRALARSHTSRHQDQAVVHLGKSHEARRRSNLVKRRNVLGQQAERQRLPAIRQIRMAAQPPSRERKREIHIFLRALETPQKPCLLSEPCANRSSRQPGGRHETSILPQERRRIRRQMQIGRFAFHHAAEQRLDRHHFKLH